MRKRILPALFLFFTAVTLLQSADYYWESPEPLVSQGARFLSRAQGDGLTALFWQESRSTGAETGEFFLSMAVTENGDDWEVRRNILGPYAFTGRETSYYSAAIDPSGRIFLAVSRPDALIEILVSEDKGRTFTSKSEIGPLATRTYPRLSLTDQGEFLLFITQKATASGRETLGIYYARSEAGESWSEPVPLVADPELGGNFLPHHRSLGGREYVVFQVFHLGRVSAFQIYSKYSDDGGATWSRARHITDFTGSDLYEGDAFFYDNQRPYLGTHQEGLEMVWERRYRGANPQIFRMPLDSQALPAAPAERVSGGNGECRSPQIFSHRGKRRLVWFDNRGGENSVFLAQKEGPFWEEQELTILVPGSTTFPQPFIIGRDLYMAWQNDYRDRRAITLLAPDKSVKPPAISTRNFRSGIRARQDQFLVQWNSPADSSGIAGYSYLWDRQPDTVPERRLLTLDRDRRSRVTADEDGSWYFHLIVQDYAGNWSDPVHIEAVRDTTPPGTVAFPDPRVDDQGYLPSNTQTLTWEPPADEDVAGYSFRFQYLAGSGYDGDRDNFNVRAPAARIQTTAPAASFRNMDNGYWALSVRAVDQVGNVGETAVTYFRLNKYIPVTYISRYDTEVDELGRITLRLMGRGFTESGAVEAVILDRDGREPYDYLYPLEMGVYRVRNDRLIEGPEIEQIDTGSYRIGLIHPERGLYFTRSSLRLESPGTVKFGDFGFLEGSPWLVLPGGRRTVSFSLVLVAAAMLLLTAALLFILGRVRRVAREGALIQAQVKGLLSGERTDEDEVYARVDTMKKQGLGLRFQFAFLITILVLIVVLMVSLPIAYVTVRNQQQVLSGGLRQRSEVLLESLTSGARTFLPTRNILELSTLPSQMSALGDDALYVTITGPGEAEAASYDPEVFDYVWAGNNPDLPEEARINRGTYRLDDPVSPLTAELREEINSEARARVGGIVEEMERLNERVEPLVADFIRTQDPALEEAIEAVQQELQQLDRELQNRLYEIGNIIRSVPEYDPEQLDPGQNQYIFYKPIVYRSSSDNEYFRGLVRLGISTEGIRSTIADSQRQLIYIILAIAVVAILLGILGSLILASIIIRPIRLLVRGVALIRDTEDKEQLKNHTINLKRRDELARLAETINDMTKGLVKAAVANKELTIGKEVQKMFIPLETDSSGNKLTTGKDEDQSLQLFGYYEGAKGVSGDYFDYMKIDDTYYAAIKCDVAGKGVPASLIMVEVATIFLNFFKEWGAKGADRKGAIPNIPELVYAINDLLEERGFKGRFAALIIVLFNTKTGTSYLCNAGDKLVHVYDNGERRMKIVELPESPAAGVFPSDLVRMGTGFVQVKYQLNPGDSLLLFTDGLEEAQRKFRNADFEVVTCQEPGLGEGDLHDTHPFGNDNEEFGIPRLQELVNSVKAGGRYTLFKYHNPIPDEELVFDFSGCTGTMEEVVMASVAVEKIFRIYPDPAAGAKSRIQVDRKINDFLAAHFLQYRDYFRHGLEDNGEGNYLYFSHLKEDEQYDDLTVLGLHRK